MRTANDAFAISKRARCPAPPGGPIAGACALQRGRAGFVAACACGVLAGVFAALAGVSSARAAGEMPASTAPPLPVMPMAEMRITGGFGEARGNHIHAGLDLSTGGHVGVLVRAPLAGWVERVRASGAGYGRSLYFHARDGRLLVFGHLDGYARAVAAYVDSAQGASGQYEQDLRPAAGRFECAAGDTLAWSGESGIGQPHLHVEVRHGDFALNPLRAGIAEPADATPRLETLTLEPLDESSYVRRSAAPYTLVLRARPETLVVEGTVRAVVRARVGLANVRGLPPWSIALGWQGHRIEARLDSISWAGEMSQQDEMFDRGRIDGSGGLILWHPASFTPRFLLGPSGGWDGRIEVAPGAPAEPLRLRARDANGRETEHALWLRGPRTGESGPATARMAVAKRRHPATGAVRWSFASLPESRVRVRLEGVPAGARDVRIGTTATTDSGVVASRDGAAWCAVLRVPVPARSSYGRAAHATLAGGGTWSAGWSGWLCRVEPHPDGTPAVPMAGLGDWAQVAVSSASLDEPGLFAIDSVSAPVRLPGCELRSGVVCVQPALMALRTPLRVLLRPYADADAADPRVLLFRERPNGGWESLGRPERDAHGWLVSESSTAGTFVVARDVTAPRLGRVRPAKRPGAFAYSRWELIARVSDLGSGLDARASAFWIDGVRVPSEWDPESSQLRWRPVRRPAPGRHAWRLEVADRAGNAARSEGSFVLDSASR